MTMDAAEAERRMKPKNYRDAVVKIVSKDIADAIYRGYGSDSHFLFGIEPKHEKAVRSIIKLAITKYKEVYVEVRIKK